MSLTNSAINTPDIKVFVTLLLQLPQKFIDCARRFHAYSAYWSENIALLLSQHSLIPVIFPKNNSRDHGTTKPLDLIFRACKNYPVLYRPNHHPEYLSSVEHNFVLSNLSLPVIRDSLFPTKFCSLSLLLFPPL